MFNLPAVDENRTDDWDNHPKYRLRGMLATLKQSLLIVCITPIFYIALYAIRLLEYDFVQPLKATKDAIRRFTRPVIAFSIMLLPFLYMIVAGAIVSLRRGCHHCIIDLKKKARQRFTR